MRMYNHCLPVNTLEGAYSTRDIRIYIISGFIISNVHLTPTVGNVTYAIYVVVPTSLSYS